MDISGYKGTVSELTLNLPHTCLLPVVPLFTPLCVCVFLFLSDRDSDGHEDSYSRARLDIVPCQWGKKCRSVPCVCDCVSVCALGKVA